MKKATTFVIALTCAIGACAKRPNAIAPATIPESAYSNMSCKELATELTNENRQLATLSQAQNSAATADAVGVFLVGVPAASLTGGDQEGAIAVSKGKIISIQASQQSKRC